MNRRLKPKIVMKVPCYMKFPRHVEKSSPETKVTRAISATKFNMTGKVAKIMSITKKERKNKTLTYKYALLVDIVRTVFCRTAISLFHFLFRFKNHRCVEFVELCIRKALKNRKR